MEEIWKDIEGYEGYFVSNKGAVKGKSKTKNENNIMCLCNKHGYHLVKLCKNGVLSSFSVHRLVAKAFIPNPDNKPKVNHINGIKNDNRVENLEWCTQKENCIHAFRTGLASISENCKISVSESNKKRGKDIIDLNTGIFYDCISEAAFAKNIKLTTLAGYLSNRRKNKSSLIYA